MALSPLCVGVCLTVAVRTKVGPAVLSILWLRTQPLGSCTGQPRQTGGGHTAAWAICSSSLAPCFSCKAGGGGNCHLFRPLQCLITTQLSLLPPSSACSLPAGNSALPSASDGGHEKLTQHPERSKHWDGEGCGNQMTSWP